MTENGKFLKVNLNNKKSSDSKIRIANGFKKEFSFNGDEKQPRQRPKRGKKKKRK